MEQDKPELPVKNPDLPKGKVQDLSLALAVILNVYSGRGSYEYKINNIPQTYNVDVNQIYEFSHLLYEISRTDIGKAAIADIRENSVQEVQKKLEDSLKFGEEKILYEKRVSNNNDIAVSCIAHALKHIDDINENLIITNEHFYSIISALGKTENGRSGIKEAKEYLGVNIRLPGENILSANIAKGQIEL